ncbi:MAG: glycosyltransferase family 39 protein [Syntrophales bacterium]|nr:glycosyltransferase family 39 protein [Syntrophales bacterium]MDD5640703.1 glycosyltransferase family 39 protein [Syntrophales bacterium]
MNRPAPSVLWSGPFLLLISLAVYLPPMFQIPLIRAEAMYALIPLEMAKSGHWLLATLNGAPYLDKPPLLYWLTIGAYKILGTSGWVARVPTLLCTLGEIWLTYLLGRRLFTPRAAWLGGFVLLSSIGFFALHLQILTDHLVTLSLIASLYFMWRWQEEPERRWALGFYLALAAGFMSKGFIGLVFPLLISGLFLWFRNRRALYRLIFNLWGLGLLALVTVPWLAAMEYVYPGFLRHYIINEQVLRFLGKRQPPDINPFSVTGFWIFLGIWLMPWTLLLPSALYRYWRESRAKIKGVEGGGLLLIWAGMILVFFTLSSSRIEYYSLPALPPLALILGWRLDRFLKAQRDRTLTGALLLIGLLGLCLLFLIPHLERLCAANRREFLGMFQLLAPVARQASYWIPGVALVAILAGWRHPRVAAAGYGALALMLCYFTMQTLVLLSPHLSDKIPGEYLRRHAGPKDLVIMESIEEFEYGASLEYFSGRHILMVQRQGLPAFPYPVPVGKDYLISPARLKELWTGPRKVFLLVDDATPLESYLQNAKPALTMQGKRLLLNHP